MKNLILVKGVGVNVLLEPVVEGLCQPFPGSWRGVLAEPQEIMILQENKIQAKTDHLQNLLCSQDSHSQQIQQKSEPPKLQKTLSELSGVPRWQHCSSRPSWEYLFNAAGGKGKA